MTATKKIQNPLLTLMALSTCIGLGCDPNVIAPIPSPIAPDEDKIVTSSLMLEVENEQPVAVVGFDGAVEGTGVVKLFNRRNGIESLVPTTRDGSFATAVSALPRDVFEVSYVDGDRVSEPVEITIEALDANNKRVSEYEPLVDEVENPPEGTSSNPDGEKNEDRDDHAPPVNVGGGGTAGAVDCEAGEEEADPCDGDGADEPATEPDPAPDTPTDEQNNFSGNSAPTILTGFKDGLFRLEGTAGSTWPGANLIFANQTTGDAVQVTANEYGAFVVEIEAELGDEIMFFSQNPENPTVTGPAQFFTVQ